MRYKEEIIALLIFFLAALAFVYPVFQNLGNWGIHDWDQHFMLNAMPRETILEFKQFPLWSPHYCGGNVMLANPQSSFLNPLYIFVLIFGEGYRAKTADICLLDSWPVWDVFAGTPHENIVDFLLYGIFFVYA